MAEPLCRWNELVHLLCSLQADFHITLPIAQDSKLFEPMAIEAGLHQDASTPHLHPESDHYDNDMFGIRECAL